MEVLLLILKIIGICLFALLGLFLFLILTIIFIPVRYRIRGRGETPSAVETDAVFSWFLHMLHIRVRYASNGILVRIRILGIPIRIGKGRKEKKRKEKKRKSKKQRSNKKENAAEQLNEVDTSTETEQLDEVDTPTKAEDTSEVDTSTKAEDTNETSTSMETEQIEENSSDTPKEDSEESHPNTADETNAEDSKKAHSKKRMARNIRKKFSIKERIKSVKEKILHWKEQLCNIKSIILEETNRNAVVFLFRELKVLLKHYTPRKVSGELRFGMEDPAATGQILGVISMLPFWHRYKISVTPDFTAEQFYAKGAFYMKGRIRSIHLLFSGIRFIKNKDMRKLMKQIRT